MKNRVRRFLLVLLIFTPALAGAALSAWPSIQERLTRGPYQPVDLQSLGSFPFNDQTGTAADIPKSIRKLDGKQVSLEGMMWNLRSASPAVGQFQLIWNLQPRPWPRPPQVQERVFVFFPKKEPVIWYGEVVRVRGTLHVDIRHNDAGTVVTVFTLTDPIIDLPPRTHLARYEWPTAWRWGLVASFVIALLVLGRSIPLLSKANRRRARGLCVRCGYDLRATRSVCPECGTPIVRLWDELG